MAKTELYLSFDLIRNNFSKAMEFAGFVKASIKCKEWGISASDLCRFLKKGYQNHCDCFIIEGTRYINIDAPNPKELKYE